MISASLLTTLKIALPVGAVATMGGTVYFASGYLPKRTGASNDVYLVVKGKTPTPTSTSTIATITGDKATKNYVCEVTLDDSTKATDKDCSLFDLNKSTTEAVKSKYIDFSESAFGNSSLTQTTDSVKATSKHILKLSKSFYQKLSGIKTTDKKQIQLTSKSDATKHLGIVSEEFNLEITKPTNPEDYSTNLFLARISAKGTNTTASTDPLTCKLSETKSVECKIYKLGGTNKNKTNALDSTDLTNLTTIDLTSSTDLVAGLYVVVELTKDRVKVSELHNKQLTINKKATTGTTPAEGDKVADVHFDQVLLGKVGTTPASSTIYPLTPKMATYVVKKGTASGSTTFNDVQDATKNYKCKFTEGTNHNYDNSCVIKTFPTAPKVHELSSMTGTATTFAAITTSTNDKEHFLLTVDKNKLFNLKTDWTKASTVNIVAIVDDASETKKADFAIQHEIKSNKAEGNTNMALVKFKSKEDVGGTASPAADKCFFEATDKTGFSCSFKKTTPASATSPYTDLTFDTSATAPFTTNDHLALLMTDAVRPIIDFEAQTIYAHLTESSKTVKYTFDIIAPMGGDASTGKIIYFLGATKTPTK